MTDNWREAFHPFVHVRLSATDNGPSIDSLAMIDTGCTTTSVSTDILVQLGLVAVGRREMSGSGGRSSHDVFSAFISVVGLGIPMQAVFLSLDHPVGRTGATTILGMDILRMGRLVLDPVPGQSRFDLPLDRALSMGGGSAGPIEGAAPQ